MTGRLRLVRALLAPLLGVSGWLILGAAPPAGAFPGATVDLVGHGYGHGRGMGQFGALGYAVNHGWDYKRILDHYYGGTRLETRPFGDITVHLTKFDGIDLIVQQKENRLGFSTGNESVPGPFRALLARHRGGNRFDVFFGTDCSGGPAGWKPLKTDVPGPITIASSNAAPDDRSDMLQICELDGTRRWLRGRVVASQQTVNSITTSRVVNVLDMEAYLKGVVPRESPASWGNLGGGKGMHALRAQAVAARSYAMAEDRYTWAKTCDTQSCQVYGGHGVETATGEKDPDTGEQTTTNRAVDETAGEVRVRLSDGKVARTEFSSSTGGYTAGGDFPAVPDAGDAIDSNPSRTWTAKIPVSVIEKAYPEIGTLLSVDVTKRNGLGDMGGRVTELVLRGSKGRQVLTKGGAELRALWSYSSATRPDGLRSDWFRVVNNPSGGLSGYWIVAADGGIFSFGDAAFHGSTGGLRLNSPILGLSATPGGQGYWLVAADGGIFSFGDAAFHGSTGDLKLNKPVVGMASTVTGDGYWLVASDGGIFSFGDDAGFFGSTGSLTLNKPVVGMAPTPTGEGYWLVASDGGIFAFGDAGFFGSTGAMKLNRPVVGMASTPTGKGYWLLAADGGLFSFGDAGFFGSLPGSGVAGPAVALRPTRTGGGYLIVTAGGDVASYGDAPVLGDIPDAVPNYQGAVVGLDVKAAPVPSAASARPAG